jgi:hypothetical protein
MSLAQPAPRASEHLHAGILHAQKFERLGVCPQGVLRGPNGGKFGKGLVGIRRGEAEEQLHARSDHPPMHHMIDKVGRNNQPIPTFHDAHPRQTVEQRLCPEVVCPQYYIFGCQLSRFLSGKSTQIQRQNNGVKENRGGLPVNGTDAASSFITQHYLGGSGAGSRRGTVLPPAPQQRRHHGAERNPIIEFRWRGELLRFPCCACGRVASSRGLGRTFSPRAVSLQFRRYLLAGANAGRPFEFQNHTHRNHLGLTARQRGGLVSRWNSNTGHHAWSAPIEGHFCRGRT